MDPIILIIRHNKLIPTGTNRKSGPNWLTMTQSGDYDPIMKFRFSIEGGPIERIQRNSIIVVCFMIIRGLLKSTIIKIKW